MFKKLKNLFNGSPANVLGFLATFILILWILSKLIDASQPPKTISHTELINSIDNKQIKLIKVNGNQISGKFNDNKSFEAVAHLTDKTWDALKANGVEVFISNENIETDSWYTYLIIFVISGVIIWFIFYRDKNKSNGSSGGMSSIFSIGKSRFKKSSPGEINIKFNDVAGAKTAKSALKDIVDFLKNPEKFKSLGARIPKGILLSGEPGNGKTLLARAVAGEANCAFISISGAEFIEVFVGVGASRIRDLFAQSRKSTPCILFIDEIDTIGRTRGSGFGGGHDEREQTLNQLLTEMDGFDVYTQPLVIMAATNIPEVLDKALLRPGRFDRVVHVPYPDFDARLELLKIHTVKNPLMEDVNLNEIAGYTQGLSGADVENLVNMAALKASQSEKSSIAKSDFQAAYVDLIRSKKDIQSSSKDTAKEFLPQQVKTKFEDVAGLENVKEDLREVVDFLKMPEKYYNIGARIPKGILMDGAPGNGKTLVAKALAGEAGVPYFYASGSQFVQKYVGVGAERIRELFNSARKHAPAIIFIDEIDSIGKRSENDGGASEYNQTINQLLTEMDGFNEFEKEKPIIVIAATNRIDMIDEALKRPGRFDRKVHIDYPNLQARIKILNVHSKGKKFDSSVDLNIVAKGTSGFSGASLENLLNEAAILAVSKNKKEISSIEIEETRENILIGKKNIGLAQNKLSIEKTAYHEAGHALLSILQKDYPAQFYKVTILSRGNTLGVSHSIAIDDEVSNSKEQLLAMIVVCMGGRVAEEIVFNKIHTGASSDFKNATKIADSIVKIYGMDDSIGVVSYHNRTFISEQTRRDIDLAVKNILDSCYLKAKNLLIEHRESLNKIAIALLEKEILEAKEVYEIAGIKQNEIN